VAVHPSEHWQGATLERVALPNHDDGRGEVLEVGIVSPIPSTRSHTPPFLGGCGFGSGIVVSSHW
jgi:hypothetical protein